MQSESGLIDFRPEFLPDGTYKLLKQKSGFLILVNCVLIKLFCPIEGILYFGVGLGSDSKKRIGPGVDFSLFLDDGVINFLV